MSCKLPLEGDADRLLFSVSLQPPIASLPGNACSLASIFPPVPCATQGVTEQPLFTIANFHVLGVLLRSASLLYLFSHDFLGVSDGRSAQGAVTRAAYRMS